MLVTASTYEVPIGVGRIQESPDSCSSASSPFQVTADWVFIGA
jgi:hypothetical protein